MEKTAHTPGPWSVAKKDTNRRVVDSTGHSVAVASGLDRAREKEAEANARLIAAAPELLAELRHLVRLMEPLEQVGGLSIPGLATLNGARVAIAKAEGKTHE